MRHVLSPAFLFEPCLKLGLASRQEFAVVYLLNFILLALPAVYGEWHGSHDGLGLAETSPCDRLRPVQLIGLRQVRQRIPTDNELRALQRRPSGSTILRSTFPAACSHPPG